MTLIEKAQTIRNETEKGANTASRVGELFEFLANPAYLDAGFSGNTTPQTVTDEWSGINADFIVEYSRLVTYDSQTKSFLYADGDFPRPIKVNVDCYAESQSNNADFEFGLFLDSGEGFNLIGVSIPYTFRQSDNTELLSIGSRFDIQTGDRFKFHIRKPSGSSDILFLSSRVTI